MEEKLMFGHLAALLPSSLPLTMLSSQTALKMEA